METIFSQDQMDFIYNLAVQNFNAGQLQQSIDLLYIICKLPGKHQALYNKGMAAAYHAQENYALALSHYQATVVMDEENQQDCLLYIAICFFELNLVVEANKVMMLFEQYASKYPLLAQKAKLYKNLIAKKLQESSVEHSV